MQNRRDFIKQGCTACVAIASYSFLATYLESCKTADPNKISFSNNQVSVPLSQMEGKNNLLIKSPSLEFDLILIKRNENDYLAMKMVCPHQDNPVVVSGNGFYCPSHGSEFDADGKATTGPATGTLKKFPVRVEKNRAVISL